MVGLTEGKIKEAKARAGERIELADDKVTGLRIRVGSGGSKTFVLRKRVAGRPVNLTLGKWHPTAFTLTDARRKARSLSSDLETSSDALAKAKTVVRSSRVGTVSDMFGDYLAYIRDEKKNRQWQESERVFKKHVLPVIGDRLADTVTRGDVSRLVDGIDGPGAARGAHAQISAFYSWAMPRLDNLPANPARDAGRPPKGRARQRVLSKAELMELWKASDAEPFPWRAAIKLLILTGARRNEVFAADRVEFNLDEALWTIPSERAKNGNTHLLHLSEAAIAVLKTVPAIGNNPKLFPASRGGEGHASGYSKAATRMREKVEAGTGVPGDWTWHDIRRTVATGMQRLGVRLEVTKAVLNHVSGTRGGIVGVYQRHDFADEKRHALNLWAAEVNSIVTGQERGNVIPLQGAGK